VNQEYTEKTHQYVGGVGSFQLSPEARSSVGDQYLASLLAQAFAAQLGRTELVADLRNGDVEAMRVPETARSSLTGQYASEWGVDRSWVMVDDYGNGWLNRGAIDNIGDVPESLRDRPELRVDPDTWSEWSSAARGDNGALATMVGSHMVASGYLRIEGDQAVLQSMDVDSRSWGLQGASFINGNLGGEAYAQRIQSRYGPLDLGDSDVSQELQGIIVRGRTGDGPSVYEQASQAADQAVGVASVAAAQPTAAGNVDQMRSVLDSFLGEFRSALAGGVNISTAPTRVVMDETAQVRLDSGSIAEIAGAVHTAVGSVHVGPAMDGQAIAASIQSALESSNGTVDLSSQLAEVVESIRMVAPDMAALVLGGQIAAHGPSVDGSVEAEALVGAAESIQVAADALQSAAGANDAEGVRALLEDLVSQMSSQAAASYAVTEELQRAAGSLSDSARDLAASTARYGNGGGPAPSAEDVTAYGGR
jgi:hypothetical protein